MGIQINGATDSITAIDGTIDVVSAIGNAGVVTATAFVGNITGNVTGNINHASNLELQVGGVTRASINSSGQFTSTGNVGIKKSVPGAPLHVLSTDTGGGNIAYFDDAGSGVTGRLIVLTTDGVASGGIKFQTVNKRFTYFGNATNKITIDNNYSRIGINTDSPSEVLHVLQSSNNAAEFRLENNEGYLLLRADSNVATYGAEQHLFHNRANNAEYLRITSAGHLGVGDNNPDTRLSVTAASGTDVVGKFTSTDARAWIQLRDNSTTDTGVMLGAEGDDMLLRAGSNTRLRIDSNGDMALGGSPITSGYKSFTIHEPGTGSGSHVRFNMTNGNTGNTGSDGFSITVNASTKNIHYIQREAADMAFQNTGGRRFTIKSDGKIGIGDFSSITPSRAVHIHEASSGAVYATFTNSTTGTSASNGFTLGIDSSEHAIFNNYSNTDIRFLCNGSERFRIDPSGRVLIGTTTEGDASANNLTIASNTGYCGMTIRSGSSSEGNIFFSDATSGAGEYVGMLRYEHNNDAMVIKTANLERLRINSTEINAKVPITGAVPAPNRNIIENGEFLVSQRMGDAASTKASSGANIQNGIENGIVDRWRMGSPSASNFSRQRVTDAPSGFAYSFKVTNDGTQYNPGNANYSLFQQIIEAPNVARLAFGTSSAKTVTLSFYVKSSYASSTWAVALGSLTGGVYTNATRTYIKSYSISSANTWERKTITFPGDTSGTWPKTGTGGGLAVVWDLGSGGNHQGTSQNTWASSADFRFSGAKNVGDSANGSWQITGIQLEIGDTATEYEHIPIQKEIERCQRYFYCSGLLGSGSWNSPTTFHCAVHHPVAMRGRVTVGDTRSGGLGNINIEPRDQYDISVFDPDAHTHYSPDQVNSNQVMNFSITGSTTTGYSGTVSMDRNNDQFWLSAEL